MSSDVSTVRTTMNSGIGGVVVGLGGAGPVTMRLFRPQPTRVLVAAPDYVRWLLAFRAACVGAHLSILTEDQRSWLTFVNAVRTCGGTVDVSDRPDNLPGRGRAYRPSLIVDEMGVVTPQRRLGSWQALVTSASGEIAVPVLRNSDLSILASLAGKTADHLRRACALTPNQISSAMPRVDSEVVVASLRRVMRVSMVPGPAEHRLLFSDA